ncbi:MAG: GNAT family N-acetyltransferase, partial [Bacteroidota bacterium]
KDRYKQEVFQFFFEDAIASNGAFLIKDLKNGEVIGSSRYKPVDLVDSAVEIGWSFLAKAYWGTGINKRIKQLMLDYAFSLVDYVVFYIAIDNVRSQKAVEKLGAKRISDFHLPLVKKSRMDYTYLTSAQKWMKNAHEK